MRCLAAILILLAGNAPGARAEPAASLAALRILPTAGDPPGQIDLLPNQPSPAPAVQTLTVAELQQLIANSLNDSDQKLAQRLSTLELSERLSIGRCASLQQTLRGKRSRDALQVLADASAFLQLPPAQIAARPPPDLATQRHIMAMTVEYVTQLAHVLPNLYATRQTLAFRNRPREVLLGRGPGMVPVWQPMRLVGRSNIHVTYRDGAEVENGAGKAPGLNARNRPLVTTGEFGPILTMVLFDAAHASLHWGHWEQGDSGLEAVFAYAVPLRQSEFEPGYCCVLGHLSQQRRAYSGEIAVNPATGAVLRLTLETSGAPGDVLLWTGTMVRYGAVELGAKSYMCPLRSVSITQALPDSLIPPAPTEPPSPATFLREGRLQTLLNDTAFEEYHLFHASVRILPAH